MTPLMLAACADELFFIKTAALNSEDTAKMKDAIRQQAKWDQASAQGKLSAEEAAAHRHNVDRIKSWRAKSKGEINTVPGWVRDPKGKPPAAAPKPGGGPRRSGPHSGPHRSPFTTQDLRDIQNTVNKKARKVTLGLGLGVAAAGLGAYAYGEHKRKQRAQAAKKAGKK